LHGGGWGRGGRGRETQRSGGKKGTNRRRKGMGDKGAEKGTIGRGRGGDNGRREGRRGLMRAGERREGTQGRSKGWRKRKIYWRPLTLNITSTLHVPPTPSHPHSLTTRRLGCCVDVVVQRMVWGW